MDTRTVKIISPGRGYCLKWFYWIILFMAIPVMAVENASAVSYMDQEPPGLIPKVFAPGIISVPKQFEQSICLSKDGLECYFRVRAADWSNSQIMVTRLENGQWTSPVQAPFSNSRSSCPSLADNDQILYFCRDVDIWKVRRTAQGWSQPEVVAAPVSSSSQEYSCHISSLGNLWTCSWRPGGLGQCDLWQIRFANGQFTEAQNLQNLNTPGLDCSPVPGPNEAYVIFSSDRPGGNGGMDLYISFPDGRGGWTAPRNLGPAINSSDHDSSPYLSPDHKYLFFARETTTEGDIYWVRVEAFLHDPNEQKSSLRQPSDAIERSK